MAAADRVWELSQISASAKPIKNPPRFREVVKFLQDPKIDLNKKFPQADKKELEKRIKFAKIWLERYAPEQAKVGLITNQAQPVNLTPDQKKYLKFVAKLLAKDWEPQVLQQELYETAKNNKIDPKSAFQAIYLVLTGKPFGPQAAWLILANKKEAIKIFEEIK